MNSDQTQPANTRRQSAWTWVIPLTVFAGLVLAYFLWPGFQDFVRQGYDVLTSEDQEQVERWVAGFGAWGFVAILSLMLMQTLIPVLPSVIAMVAAVLAYGGLLGGAIAWGGMLLAAALGYAIGRLVGPVTVDRMLGGNNRKKVSHFVHRYGFWAVIAARISPVLSTDAVSIVAGLAAMKFLRFLLATAVGTLPLTILIAFLGEEIERLKTGLVWLSVASLAVFIAYVVFDRRSHSYSDD